MDFLREMVSCSSPQMFSEKSLERLGHSVEGLIRLFQLYDIVFSLLLPLHQVILMIWETYGPFIFL